MAVSSAQIKALREKTGAGILNCKKALEKTDGDVEAAIIFLRKKGLASAEKKSSRIATEGLVLSYIHGEGRIGVLLEVNCETDFVGRTDQFASFCKDIAMHIAAAAPRYLSRDEVGGSELEKERDVLTAQALAAGKPPKIVERIVEGRISKFYSEYCLLEQSYIKDNTKTVQMYLTEQIAALGENMSIRRFTRYVLGEGLEKKVDNFVEEVARQVSS